MNIKDLLKQEKECRRDGQWLMFSGEVKADNNVVILVEIKSHGFYNQILRVGASPCDHCSGHTIDKVKAMHDHIAKVINEAAAEALEAGAMPVEEPPEWMTPHRAKKLLKGELERLGIEYDKLSAKTVDFTDLARATPIFVKIHGCKSYEQWGELKAFAKANGFYLKSPSLTIC